jgi:hypothetical protein
LPYDGPHFGVQLGFGAGAQELLQPQFLGAEQLDFVLRLGTQKQLTKQPMKQQPPSTFCSSSDVKVVNIIRVSFCSIAPPPWLRAFAQRREE